MELWIFYVYIFKTEKSNKLWEGDLISLFLSHPEHSSLTLVVPKEYCGIEPGNDLPVPAMFESHEMSNPLFLTRTHDFIKYCIVLPNHVVPIHILCLMSDFGLFQNDCGVEVLLKWSSKPLISSSPRLYIWIFSNYLLTISVIPSPK